MKRNDIVLYNNDAFITPYGRVNRVIDKEHVEVIDCCRAITIYHIKDLEIVNYKGYYDLRGIFHRMPSLRKLKQRASRYDKTIWKKYRK